VSKHDALAFKERIVIRVLSWGSWVQLTLTKYDLFMISCNVQFTARHRWYLSFKFSWLSRVCTYSTCHTSSPSHSLNIMNLIAFCGKYKLRSSLWYVILSVSCKFPPILVQIFSSATAPKHPQPVFVHNITFWCHTHRTTGKFVSL
jgi:hypothetical protein